MLTFSKAWKVNNTLVNADGGVTIAVYDETTATQVVAPGTAMQNVGTGLYQYSLSSNTPGDAYTATITVIYDGQTYTYVQNVPGDASDPQEGHKHRSLHHAIEENATSAMKVSTAAGSAESHSLPDQIAADQYLASRRAAKKGRSGLRVMPLRGGPTG